MKHVSDLLGSLLERKHIRVQVEAAQAVEAANAWIEASLPPSRQEDACAMSVQAGRLMVACTSSAAAAFVNDHAEEMIAFVCQRLPRSSVASVATRLVSGRESYEL